MRTLALHTLALALCVGAAPALAGETPDEIPGTEAAEPIACPTWTGQIVGNATASVTLVLCPGEGESVTGTFDFSSPDAGRSTRSLVGTWTEDNLVLEDTAMLVDKPNPGWHFCLIDAYRLRRTPTGGLLGEYDSEACSDHAKVALSRTAVSVPPESSAPPAPEDDAKKRAAP